jgi:hypothetical protein
LVSPQTATNQGVAGIPEAGTPACERPKPDKPEPKKGNAILAAKRGEFDDAANPVA